MEKDNKTLLAAILIILVAVVAFNLGKPTGQVVKEKVTTISVTPKVVYPGDTITVTVKPGNYGSSKYVSLYKAGVGQITASLVGQTTELCEDIRCYDAASVRYVVPSGWKGWESGEYYATVYDYYSSENVPRSRYDAAYTAASFTVR